MVHIIDLSDSAKLQRWQSRKPMRNDPRITAIKRTLASKEKSRDDLGELSRDALTSEKPRSIRVIPHGSDSPRLCPV